MDKKLQLSLLAGPLLAIAAGANASIIQNGTVDLTGQGFGAVPRLLTIQAQGNNTTESGAIGIAGGALVAQTPGVANGSVFGGNGITNAGGDTVPPLTDANKFGIPTLGSLNWTTASNVALLFNPSESQGQVPSNGSTTNGGALTIQDVTLKFYNGNTLVTAIDGGNITYANTDPGVGQAGFLLSVDAAQQTHLNSTVFNQTGSSSYRIALESTIANVSGGPESYAALGRGMTQPIPEPQTYAMMLAGLGLLGFARIRRSRKDKP
jgi:hypothetical protein